VGTEPSSQLRGPLSSWFACNVRITVHLPERVRQGVEGGGGESIDERARAKRQSAQAPFSLRVERGSTAGRPCHHAAREQSIAV
jgi:hypothetical protein